MDLFTYTTRSAAIDSLTLVKDIEEKLRELSSLVYTNSWTFTPPASTTNIKLDEVIRPFMLFTKCFKKFEDKSKRELPDFLYNNRTKAATNVIAYLTYSSQPISYEQYLEIFQYLNVNLVLPTSPKSTNLGLESGVGSLIYLTKVVGNNPNPYHLSYVKLNYSELYSLSQQHVINPTALLHAISLRQNVFNDKTYTILEDFINYHTTVVKQSPNPMVTPNLVLEAQQLLNASIEYERIVNVGATDTIPNN